MPHFITLPAVLLALTVGAQSPLVVAPPGAALFSWPVPATSHQTFFDLTVHTTITLQALAAPLVSPAGQQGTMELWLTNQGTTTYVGNETNAARWHRAASGLVHATGTTSLCLSCQDASGVGLVLTPGSYGCAIRYVGVVTQFCAVPIVPNVVANTELTLSGGAIQFNAFSSTPAPVGGGYSGWSWYGQIHYAIGAVSHACAEATSYGSGCLDRHASVYGRYTTASAAANALDGKSLSFVLNAIGGYDVVPGIPLYPYVPPSAAALQVPLTSDGEYQQSLTVPFVHPTGIASSLFIHSNGFVSVASNNVLSGANWNPQPGAFLNAPATGWWSWHDFNPAEAGGGSVWFEEDPSTARIYITWLGVESSPTGVVNPSTFQMTFDPSLGVVTMHFVAIDSVGGATNPPGDGWIIGYSPGGASPDPGATNLGALMAGTGPHLALPPGEVAPLALSSSGTPRVGTTITLQTTNQTGFSIGFTVLATTAADPAISLAPLGAPSCSELVDPASGVAVMLSNGGLPGTGMGFAFLIPNNPGFLGVALCGQSVWLDGTANAMGIVTSNGLRLRVGNY